MSRVLAAHASICLADAKIVTVQCDVRSFVRRYAAADGMDAVVIPTSMVRQEINATTMYVANARSHLRCETALKAKH